MSFKMPLMALAVIIANLPAAHAEDGVSTDRIVLGQAAALSGSGPRAEHEDRARGRLR